jgi:thioredoxin reductase
VCRTRGGNLPHAVVSVAEWQLQEAGLTQREQACCSSGSAVHDVCIVGGGPAGLSAAVWLGRCRRRVELVDSGKPRNAMSRGLHGFLTRDGVSPLELRNLGRADVARYSTVEIRDDTVVRAARAGDVFTVQTRSGAVITARTLLLATGRTDVLPTQRGFAELYGRGVYHCPFCDGWEHRDEPLAVHGCGVEAFDFARELLTWSADVTLCSDGPCQLDDAQRRRLAANRIVVIETPIAVLQASNERMLERIRFASGDSVACRALFFVSPCPQRSFLPESLGCEFDETGAVRCHGNAATNVPGLFVAGNVRCGLHFAITAAAEGAEAAVAINDALLEADLA